jgi:hypothetical protein
MQDGVHLFVFANDYVLCARLTEDAYAQLANLKRVDPVGFDIANALICEVLNTSVSLFQGTATHKIPIEVMDFWKTRNKHAILAVKHRLMEVRFGRFFGKQTEGTRVVFDVTSVVSHRS